MIYYVVILDSAIFKMRTDPHPLLNIFNDSHQLELARSVDAWSLKEPDRAVMVTKRLPASPSSTREFPQAEKATTYRAFLRFLPYSSLHRLNR